MIKETIEKAYGNIPKEIGMYYDWGIPTIRGMKYYWLLLIRKIRRVG